MSNKQTVLPELYAHRELPSQHKKSYSLPNNPLFHHSITPCSDLLNLRAYAKINLGLQILGKRPDGYHNISTIFHRIGLYDELQFTPASSIQVESTSSAAPGDESNICHKAAVLLQKHFGVLDGVRISVRKNIPVGAGLGGGSSDAAVVLNNLPQFWGKQIDGRELHAIALELGSDVPYFLTPGSALGTGRGEILEYFPLHIPYFILLCNPNIHVSTAWAYTNFKPAGASQQLDLKSIVSEGMNNPRRLESLRNDFEAVVFGQFPEIGNVKGMMLNNGAVFALMSGSGSSVFGLFSSEAQAVAASAVLQQKGHFTSITPPGFSPA